MDKINGYTKEEAEELARYISEGRRAGKTPRRSFRATAGRTAGRAAASATTTINC